MVVFSESGSLRCLAFPYRHINQRSFRSEPFGDEYNTVPIVPPHNNIAASWYVTSNDCQGQIYFTDWVFVSKLPQTTSPWGNEGREFWLRGQSEKCWCSSVFWFGFCQICHVRDRRHGSKQRTENSQAEAPDKVLWMANKQSFSLEWLAINQGKRLLLTFVVTAS